MIRTEGLTHIHLVVRDLERSLRFYQGVFGMEERFREGPKMVFLNTPGSTDLITLYENPAEAELAGVNGGVAHFGFRLANASELGRAIAESSFHHLVNYNWDISAGCPTFITDPPGDQIRRTPERLADIKTYVSNVARWLA